MLRAHADGRMRPLRRDRDDLSGSRSDLRGWKRFRTTACLRIGKNGAEKTADRCAGGRNCAAGGHAARGSATGGVCPCMDGSLDGASEDVGLRGRCTAFGSESRAGCLYI